MRILIDGQTLDSYEIRRGIGRVFLALINQIVSEYEHIHWYITVRDKKNLAYFYPGVAAKLIPIIIDFSNNLAPIHDSISYSHHLQPYIHQYQIDIYWNLNPLMLNVFFPGELNNVATHVMIHDLIPLVLGNVNHWPNPQREDYERRLIDITAKANHIAAISQSTYDDLISYYPAARPKCSVIHHGINPVQFYSQPVKIPLYQQPYILYVGGFDIRKNMFLAIEAFAKLCAYPNTDSNLQFYVVCAANQEQIEQFYQSAQKWNIHTRITLFPSATDTKLALLYANAELFFFPSRYEGFGLPVLEAMAAGIIVVASEIAVLHEIGQEAILYCHPENSTEMALRLQDALSLSSEQKHQLSQRGLQLAATFNWEKTAAAYLKTLQEGRPLHSSKSTAVDKAIANISAQPVPKIALATPWPPEKSGIADYSYHLVQKLQQYCSITIFSQQSKFEVKINNRTGTATRLATADNESLLSTGMEVSGEINAIDYQPLANLEPNINEFDLVVYQLGNDANHHREIYKLAWNYPGVVILHDFYLYQFIQEAFYNKKDHALFEAALKMSRQQQQGVNVAAAQMAPLSEAIVHRSLAAVVHNTWVRQQLSAFANVHLIPHGAVINDTLICKEQQRMLINEWGLKDHYVIGVFGFMNHTKRFASIVQAIAKLHHKHYPIKLLVVGELDNRHCNIAEVCHKLNLPQDLMIITGYVDNQSFINYMDLCDIYVGLRQPSMGETSGPLIKALALGKACIVSNYQQFAQLPDDICFKILTDEREIPHLTACIESLLRQPELRYQLGQNAKSYIKKHATYEIAAQHFAELFTKIAAVPVSV